MRKIVVLSSLIVLSLLLIAAPSAGQQKKQNNPKKKDTVKKDTVKREETTSEDYVNLAKVKEVGGKLADINLNTGVLTLTYEWQHYEPNPNPNTKDNQKTLKLQQQLQRDYDKIMRTTNPVQRQRAMTQYQQDLQRLQAQGAINLQNMFQLVKSSKDLELNTVEKLKVARNKLVAKYNDEGELIKYTAEELKKMKSPEVQGAYIATPDDLRPGQVVLLYLSPPKKQDAKKSDDTKKSDTSGGSSDSKDGKDSQPMRVFLADRPQIRMILIVDDPGVPELTNPHKK